MTDLPLGLYIHIPFCQTKCAYCNFNTYARIEALIPSYIEALGREIEAWGERLGRPEVRTVFFGGGTPSWVPAGGLARVLDSSRAAFRLQSDAEITAEANPGDIDTALLAAWHRAGINRISMGVQSFDDGLLRLLTRRHTAAEAVESYGMIRGAGFGSVSFDLIYGLPGQTLGQWRDTIEQAVRLDPPHISMYALTVEEGTPLWTEVRQGRVPEPDPDLAAEMYELAEEAFARAGYEHYEISNWAKPGHASRHNLIYWRNEPFLGVGPGAHSWLNGERFWNIKSPAEYVKRLTDPSANSGRTEADIPVIEERRPVPVEEQLSETLILALRLDTGVDAGALAERFGAGAVAPHIETLDGFTAMGLLTRDGPLFRLTPRGRLLSNEVFVELVAR